MWRNQLVYLILCLGIQWIPTCTLWRKLPKIHSGQNTHFSNFPVSYMYITLPPPPHPPPDSLPLHKILSPSTITRTKTVAHKKIHVTWATHSKHHIYSTSLDVHAPLYMYNLQLLYIIVSKEREKKAMFRRFLTCHSKCEDNPCHTDVQQWLITVPRAAITIVIT